MDRYLGSQNEAAANAYAEIAKEVSESYQIMTMFESKFLCRILLCKTMFPNLPDTM